MHAPAAHRDPRDAVDDATIRADVRRQLPAHAFHKQPRKLVEVAVYIGGLCSCYGVIRYADSVWVYALCALLIGLCHLSLGFIAHDISHGSVIRGKATRAIVESLIWALNATSAAAWIVNHNRVHHQHTNGRHDSFRYFSDSERGPFSGLYSLMFLPNRHLPWNLGVLQIYTVQIWTHTLGVALGGGRGYGTTGPISNLGVYSPGHRLRLYAEIVLIVLIQFAVFWAVGAQWQRYLWAGPIALTFASAGASSYLFTQHSLHPLVVEADQFMTTSLRLPRWVDALHSNHSHHTAHHLFPGLRSDFYPEVTEILARSYPHHLHQMRFAACWKLLFRNSLFKANPEATAPVDAAPPAPQSDRAEASILSTRGLS